MGIAGRATWGGAKPTAGAKDGLADNDKRALLGMARRAIRHTLDSRKAPPAGFFAKEATENMRREMGCFVTLNLKQHHELRGCIGEIVARRPLYQAVTELAVHSAFGDRRFPELRPSEFDAITIEISALTPEHPVASWRDIEIGRHGMTLSKNGCSAVFLPQVAPEQGWTREETLSHLAMKAGLGRDAWREGATFTVFEAIVFRETDFQGV
jgi:AmmeMemoRadiSam system protein A